jgi:Strictosidine synthase
MSIIVELVRDLIAPNSDKDGIPVLDGPWLPNEKLESLEAISNFPNGLDDAVSSPAGGISIASGSEVLRLDLGDSGRKEVSCSFSTEVSGLSTYENGGLIVCLANSGVVFRGGSLDGLEINEANGIPIRCPIAATASPDGIIYIADGSIENDPSRWVHDLMEKRESGRLIRFDPRTGRATTVLERLAYPHGLAWSPDGSLLITESWRHRIRRVNLATQQTRRPDYVITNLPGYPARVSRAADGGYWLALFAMRTQLIEFVLKEDDYRREMMAEIEPQYWIAPMLYSADYYMEPLQQGGLKQLGVKKPWAPPRSYGLVAKLNHEFQVQHSWHSRAGRARHGITSVCETPSGALAVSKGNSLILKIV